MRLSSASSSKTRLAERSRRGILAAPSLQCDPRTDPVHMPILVVVIRTSRHSHRHAVDPPLLWNLMPVESWLGVLWHSTMEISFARIFRIVIVLRIPFRTLHVSGLVPCRDNVPSSPAMRSVPFEL